MHLRLLLLATVLAAALAAPATAGTSLTYKGRATSMDRDFRYGAVRVVIRDGRVRSLKIEAVTTTGCGGFMTLVFAPSDPETQIVSGSARVRDGRLNVTYRPVRSVEDQTTRIRARVTSSTITGTFLSGDLCVNEGRFTARR